MLKRLFFNNIPIRIDDGGDGFPLVFLHGYLESLAIWDDFVCPLAEQYRIITIDLPGHGLSGITAGVQTMESMADAVKFTLDELKIEKCILIGHSMGGYVTLAFLELYPEKLLGFSLFHSKPQADTETAIQNRKREIGLVMEGKKSEICRVNIPKAFATDNIHRFSEEIDFAKRIALQTSDEGIIASLKGMMIRPGREQLLKNTNLPFLYILGKKDNYIPFDALLSSTGMPIHTTLLALENSGHMGFFEEKETCLKAIRSFAGSILK